MKQIRLIYKLHLGISHCARLLSNDLAQQFLQVKTMGLHNVIEGLQRFTTAIELTTQD